MRGTHSIALLFVLGALLACKAKAKEQLPAPPEPPKTEPAKTEPAKTEPANTEPAKAELVNTEPAKTEPPKADPTPTQPAGPAGAEADPPRPQAAGTTQPTSPLIYNTPHPQGFRPATFVKQPVIKPESMGGSGIPRAKALRDLTASDTAKLCDWYASMCGGYGAVTTCEHNTNHAPKSRAKCQSDLLVTSHCTVTVGETEACLSQLWRSSCSSVNIFKVAACHSYLACAFSAMKEGDRRK